MTADMTRRAFVSLFVGAGAATVVPARVAGVPKRFAIMSRDSHNVVHRIVVLPASAFPGPHTSQLWLLEERNLEHATEQEQ